VINSLQPDQLVYDLERTLGCSGYILFFHGSFGDVYPNFALLASFYEEHESHITVIVDQKYEGLCMRYQLPQVSYFIVESEDSFKRHVLGSRGGFKFRKGSVFSILPTLYPGWGELTLSYSLTDFQTKRLLLRLPLDAQFKWSGLDSVVYYAVRDRFDTLGLDEGRSVLLAPFTQSNSMLDLATIKLLATEIRGRCNLAVAVNIAGASDSDVAQITGSGLTCIKIVPEEMCESISFFSLCITSLSGFCFPLLMESHDCKILIYSLLDNSNVNVGNHQVPDIRRQFGPDFPSSKSVTQILLHGATPMARVNELIHNLSQL